MSEHAPLRGSRILVPRGGEAGRRMSAAVQRFGGIPVVVPLIETAPPADPAPLADAAARWNGGEFAWLAATSANGAAALADAGAGGRSEGRVAAVGPATAEALEARGFRVDLVPEHDFSGAGLAAALVEAIGNPTGAAILLPLSEIADDTLETALRQAGHRPERVTAYRTVAAPPDPASEAAVAAGAIDAVLVTSGSVAREVARLLATSATRAPQPARASRTALLVAIGEPTARILEGCGIPADVTASEHTVPGMLAALAAALEAPAPLGPGASASATPEDPAPTEGTAP